MVYELTSVTYGTTSALYIALPVLKQLAYEERIHCPRAARAFDDSRFIDGILTGADTPE